MDPREFMKDYVLPAMSECNNARREHTARKMTVAFCELDNLAEHFILHTSHGLASALVGQERTKLGEAHPIVALARDIHDTHKHGKLKARKFVRVVSQGQKPVEEVVM